MPEVFRWDPERPRWADVNRWVRIADMPTYAAAATARCVGIKMAEGTGWVGTLRAQRAVRAARDAGLIVIGYQYGPAKPDAFLRAFPPEEGCIPALDFEFRNVTAQRWEWRQRVSLASEWIRRVEAEWKRVPWFYAGHEWRDAGEPTDTAVSRLPYWGARYGPRLVVPKGVGEPVAWQYSDGRSGPEPHSIAGIENSAPCDMNVLLVSHTRLLRLAGYELKVITSHKLRSPL